MRSSVLIYNPTSGRQLSMRRLPVVLKSLEDGGFDVVPRPTMAAGDATRLARSAVEEGAEVVFAMGGDGTLREAAAGILGSEAALGVLPAGTANVFSRALGLPGESRAAARAVARGRIEEIDVGEVISGDAREPFLMMVSGGLDATVMARQNPVWKKRLGRAAFAGGAFGAWWSYTHPEIEIRLDDGAKERATLVAVCNIPFYGGAFRMAPTANLQDGELDLVLFRGHGRGATLGFARDLALGRHGRRRDVTMRRVRRVDLSAPPEVRFQVDGDLLESSGSLRVEIASERLRILLPATAVG